MRICLLWLFLHVSMEKSVCLRGVLLFVAISTLEVDFLAVWKLQIFIESTIVM